jgi:glycosyltransferase involved in cell wall biosynthesis
MKVIITIAVYNEEKVIGSILEKIPSEYDVVVVDDGSKDRTSQICRKSGATVVRHVINLGQGAAVLTSFKKALEMDSDIIIEMDGDGQHDPKDIPRFIEAIEKNSRIDIVVGSRILGSSYRAPFFRRTFLPYVTGVINIITGYKLTDAMSGFRAFRTDSLRRCNSLLNDFLEPQYLASEMFIKLSRQGMNVCEIPIHISSRGFGFSYKGLIRYGWGVFRTIVRTLLNS